MGGGFTYVGPLRVVALQLALEGDGCHEVLAGGVVVSLLRHSLVVYDGRGYGALGMMDR